MAISLGKKKEKSPLSNPLVLYLLTYNPSPAEKTATQLICENAKITATTSVQNIKVYQISGINSSRIIATITAGQKVRIVYNTTGIGVTSLSTGDACSSTGTSLTNGTDYTQTITGTQRDYTGLSASTYTFSLGNPSLTTATTVQIQ